MTPNRTPTMWGGHTDEIAQLQARRHAQGGAPVLSPAVQPPSSHLAGGNFLNFLVGIIGWEPEP